MTTQNRLGKNAIKIQLPSQLKSGKTNPMRELRRACKNLYNQ